MTATTATAPDERRRIESVDLLRGIIMILMALDHTRDYIGNVVANPTDLRTASSALFLTRWITHFCAPNFSMLTGVGAFLMLRRRPTREVSVFLLTRGIWLIVLEATLMRFLWQFNVDYQLTFLTVLWALGWSMIFLSAIMWLPAPAIAAIAIGILGLHNLVDGTRPPAGGIGKALWFLLASPFPLIDKPHLVLFVGYVIIPWSGFMILGFALGRVFAWYPEERRKFLLRAGVATVIAFIVLRASNLYGDPRPWATQPSPLFTLWSFINATKQPPSLIFALMTIGPSLLFLAWADRGTPSWLRFAVTIGRVPMFYFAAHVLVIHLLALVEAAVRYHSVATVFQSPTMDRFPITQPPGWPASLPMVWLAWIGVVAVLYPMCRWYDRYKSTHSYRWLSYL